MRVSLKYMYQGVPLAEFETSGQRHPLVPSKDELVQIQGVTYRVEYVLHKPVESECRDEDDRHRVFVVLSKIDTGWTV